MAEEEINKDHKLSEYYISELEAYTKILRSNKDYSIQRIDILLISICGAGIYTSFELMKYISSSSLLTKQGISYLNGYFKVTGLLFTIGIIVNFISQWTAYKATSLAIESTKGIIFIEKGLTNVDLNKVKAQEKWSNYYNRITGKTNTISIVAMLLGLACMIVFIWKLF